MAYRSRPCTPTCFASPRAFSSCTSGVSMTRLGLPKASRPRSARSRSSRPRKEHPMKPNTALMLVVCSAVSLVATADPVKRDFESDAVGAPPAGFEFGRTGGGAEGKWVVRVEKGADKNHVLVQESADTTDYRFPVAVLKEGSYKDVTLTVRARPLSGKVDQGFGLVWRYQDVNNYYITRCNADEDNCTIYHTVNGRRRAFLNHD